MTTTVNPHEDGDISVTVKYGKDFKDTWAVFKGTVSKVREDIVTYFGMDRDSVSGMTVHEIALEATTIAHSTYAAKGSLGGKVLKAPVETPQANQAEAKTEVATEGGDPWASVESGSVSTEAPAANPILAEIEAVDNVADLQKLWATNQPAFMSAPDAADVMAAWKAKGKSLSGAK